MTITVTDLFCGAGGSSLGAEAAGMQLVMAANHWQTAIDVHQAHFPDAGHDVADISQADPRRYPRTDVLLASPECTNHSQARGVSRKRQDTTLWDAPDPAAERSRATMWDVPRFAEQLNYDAIVVENVVEATKWVGWRGWCQVMDDLGYSRRTLSHNSMHHGVAQSDKTRARILAGLQRHGWAPITTAGAGNVWEGTPGMRARPLTHPVPAQCTTTQTALSTPPGFLFQTAHGGRIVDLDQPHPTVCASDDRHALVLTNRTNAVPRDVGEPMTTLCAGGTHHGLVVPCGGSWNDDARHNDQPMRTLTSREAYGLLMRNNGGGAEMVTPVDEPARTVTTAGHQSLLMPYYGQSKPRPVLEPTPTVTTRDRCAVIDPDQVVDDCGFRMLEPHEIAAAMAFPAGYIPDTYTKRDRVKLAGNAVTPPVMQWITGRIAQALEAA